ncbi:MAG: hypothetical protein R6W73_00160 [Candidatus Saliniplasma sp.]
MLLTGTQLYALFFLVGCFSVKSLLDLQNWASRRDLWELWIVFIVAMVGHDAVLQPGSTIYLGAKWVLIAVITSIFYLKEINFMVFDDKLAFLAALSLLHPLMTPFLVLIHTGLVLLLKRRIKHGFSHSKKIPTLPVLTTALVFTVFLFFFY